MSNLVLFCIFSSHGKPLFPAGTSGFLKAALQKFCVGDLPTSSRSSIACSPLEWDGTGPTSVAFWAAPSWVMTQETFPWLPATSTTSSSSQLNGDGGHCLPGLPEAYFHSGHLKNEQHSIWHFQNMFWFQFKWLAFVFDMIKKVAEES